MIQVKKDKNFPGEFEVGAKEKKMTISFLFMLKILVLILAAHT